MAQCRRSWLETDMMSTVDPARLDAIRAAGLRRDYDFNYRDYYKTTEEAAAFEEGLRLSMLERPIKESRFKIVQVRYLTLNEVLPRMHEEGAYLVQCQHCDAIVDEADCMATGILGERLCPLCNATMVLFNEDRLDEVFPWRCCEGCGYSFLWDDALGGGGTPGTYLCPKCGAVT
jgi:hypothetical protein